MNTEKNNPFQRRRRITLFYLAAIFISAGVLLLGRNAGWIGDYWFRILFSWQMLLVLLGFGSFFEWKIGQGVALWATAAFFLMPYIRGETFIDYWASWAYFRDYWPVFLIIGGLGMLLDLVFIPKQNRRHRNAGSGDIQENDGFVYAITSFYGLRHTVTAPVFRGARLEVSFGSLTLDLRHTRLDAPETYIDLKNSFGGMEIYVPSDWNVEIHAHTSFGGLDDKRFMGHATDWSHKLVIRGNNSFGGVEIKS